MPPLLRAFVIGTLLSTVAAHAEGLDYAAGFSLRTLPRGTSVMGQLGYGKLLWGERTPGAIAYGYVRPYAETWVSVLVNRLDLGVQLYPISFMGLAAGVSDSIRLINIPVGNCAQQSCAGQMRRAFVQAELLSGYGPLFAIGVARYTAMRGPDTGLPSPDEGSSLVVDAGGDGLVMVESTVGAKIDDQWTVGVFFQHERMLDIPSSNLSLSAYVTKRSGAWSYLGGAGVFRSDYQSLGPAVYGGIRWTGAPGVGLR